MNKKRLAFKFGFFVLVIAILQLVIPVAWATGIIWSAVGAIGISRIFPDIFRFKHGGDIVDILIATTGIGLGFVTYLVAEILGDEESTVQEPNSSKVTT